MTLVTSANTPYGLISVVPELSARELGEIGKTGLPHELECACPAAHLSAWKLISWIVGKALPCKRNDIPGLLMALQQREARRSTGYGRGFAFPHVCNALVTQSRIVHVHLANGLTLEFGSLDGMPASVFLCCLMPAEKIKDKMCTQQMQFEGARVLSETPKANPVEYWCDAFSAGSRSLDEWATAP